MVAVAWALLPGWNFDLWLLDSCLLSLLLEILGLLDDLVKFCPLELLMELVFEVVGFLLEVIGGLLDVLSDHEVSGFGSLDHLPRSELWFLDLDVVTLVDRDQFLDALLDLVVFGLSLAPLELGDPVLKLVFEVVDSDTLTSSVEEQEVFGSAFEVLSAVGVVSLWHEDLDNLVVWLVVIDDVRFVVVVVSVVVDDSGWEAYLVFNVNFHWVNNLPSWGASEVATRVLFLVDSDEVLVLNSDAMVFFVAVGVLDFVQVVSTLLFEVLWWQCLDVVLWDLHWLGRNMMIDINVWLGRNIMIDINFSWFIIIIMSRSGLIALVSMGFVASRI